MALNAQATVRAEARAARVGGAAVPREYRPGRGGLRRRPSVDRRTRCSIWASACRRWVAATRRTNNPCVRIEILETDLRPGQPTTLRARYNYAYSVYDRGDYRAGDPAARGIGRRLHRGRGARPREHRAGPQQSGPGAARRRASRRGHRALDRDAGHPRSGSSAPSTCWSAWPTTTWPRPATSRAAWTRRTPTWTTR